MGWVFDIIFGGLHALPVGDFSPTDAQSQIIKEDLDIKMGGLEKEEEITDNSDESEHSTSTRGQIHRQKPCMELTRRTEMATGQPS